MTKAKLKQRRCDALVVGSNLAAWMTAYQLKSKGLEVTLIDSRDHRDFSSQIFFRNHYDAFSIDGPGLSHLNDLTELLGRNIQHDELDFQAVTVESGQLIPFVGFGDRALASIDELNPLITSRRGEVTLGSCEIYTRLVAALPDAVLYQSEITSVELNDKRIESVIINGATRFEVSELYYCDSPKSLVKIMPEGSLNKKIVQKIAKSRLWTTVGLEFLHESPPSESGALHVLMGTKNDFEPCLGRFYQASHDEKERRGSVWISLIEDDEAEDTERVGSILRNMKRQIKRAYPEFFDSQPLEKIWVLPSDFGHLQLDENDYYNLGIDNLTLATPLSLESDHGLSSALSVAHQVSEKSI